MKRTIAALMVLGVASICLPGCSDTSSVKQELKTTTPDGTTTTTIEKKVEKTGENPP